MDGLRIQSLFYNIDEATIDPTWKVLYSQSYGTLDKIRGVKLTKIHPFSHRSFLLQHNSIGKLCPVNGPI